MVNRISATIIFLIFGLFSELVPSSDYPQKVLVRVPNAQHLFGISVAPSGNSILLYSSPHKPDGEVSSGTAVLVRVSSASVAEPLKVPEALDDLAAPVWDSDGKKAYFLTEAGIYSFDASKRVSRLIVRGTLAGLALSPDGSKLAFWDLGTAGSNYVLTIYDVRSNGKIHDWKTPVQFDGDQYGHEIEFSTDGAALFARTYDTEGQTPLKRFEVEGGKIQTISEDCVGLAASRSDIYFIRSDQETAGLFRLGPGSLSPEKVLAPFDFDSLMSSGTKRWIVAMNNRGKRIAIYDTETRTLASVGAGCEDAATLVSGEVVCSRGGELFVQPSR